MSTKISSRSDLHCVSSSSLGIDRDEVQTFYLDLYLDVVREYTRRAFPHARYNPSLQMWEVESTYNTVSDTDDCCGDMTKYYYPFYLPRFTLSQINFVNGYKIHMANGDVITYDKYTHFHFTAEAYDYIKTAILTM